MFAIKVSYNFMIFRALIYTKYYQKHITNNDSLFAVSIKRPLDLHRWTIISAGYYIESGCCIRDITPQLSIFFKYFSSSDITLTDIKTFLIDMNVYDKSYTLDLFATNNTTRVCRKFSLNLETSENALTNCDEFMFDQFEFGDNYSLRF
jgi:hypothetical protein